MKKLLSIFTLAFLKITLTAQPAIMWQKSLGGTKTEMANDIQSTSDGGSILAAFSSSNDNNVSGNHGDLDAWIVKTDSSGNIQWQKCFGGSGEDNALSIRNTPDGGYVFAGYTGSNDGDVSGNHGLWDFWVVKLSESGALEWQKTLGGNYEELAYSIQPTSDGGYILSGITNSTNGQVSGNHGENDVWVVKLNHLGVIEWQKTLGGSKYDAAYEVRQTSDEGYIVSGITLSEDGNVSALHGFFDAWVLKLDSLGNLQWEKTFGGSGEDNALSILQANDGGYVLSGYSNSTDGDLPNNHGHADCWVLKMSETGDIQWQNALGGSEDDYLMDISSTEDGGYAVVGRIASVDGDITLNHGNNDIWALKLNSEGVLQWQKSIGGTDFDEGRSIKQTGDGGYVLTGFTTSKDGDATSVYGGVDVWVVKLSSESVGIKEIPIAESLLNLEIYPNPATERITATNASEEPFMFLQIIHPNGQVLLQQTIANGGNLNISTLPRGNYTITATTPSGKRFSNKFSKQD